MTLAIVCGMEREAVIVRQACPKATVIVGAGDAAALSAKLEVAIAAGATAVISVGLAGAINLAMKTGDVVVGVGATYELGAVACDLAWCDRLFDVLQADPPSMLRKPFRVSWGRFAWSPTAVARLTDKAALRKATMADLVDEETFLALSIAAAHGVPGAALRVVLDPALFELPQAATEKLTAAGAPDMGAILGSIAGDPWEIPELFELAGMSATGLSNLRAALARVGPDLGSVVA